MKKISLKGITKVLNEKEMKNVKGGSGTYTCGYDRPCKDPADWCVNGYCKSRPY